MPNMIWQAGMTGDDIACAQALRQKYGSELVTVLNVQTFETLTRQDRLHIVANFTFLEGRAGPFTPQAMAEFLIGYGLSAVKHISLVICNSADPCPALGNVSFMNMLKFHLATQALNMTRSLFVGMISGRFGYVNVYNQVIKTSDEDIDVVLYFTSKDRVLEIGRKYSHTEPTIRAFGNRFIDKGLNKIVDSGFEIVNGCWVA